MSEPKIIRLIRLIDRTRTVQDWRCPRSRYLGYEYLGRGIVKQGTSLALYIGITVHDALAFIATNNPPDVDEVASLAFKQVHDNIMESSGGVILPDTIEFAKEQGTLTEGLIRGFYKHVWPRILADYKIISVEQEMEYTIADGYVFMTRPDLIVENSEGDLIYLEYKTTSSKKESWINSWETAVQLHSSIKATEQTLGRKPAYVQILGLYKGYESYGKQSSPFCYAYMKKGNPPFTQDQVQYAYKAGFKRYPTWEMTGGVKAWIEGMPSNILADQFPQTPPIMVNDDLIESFFNQRLIREKEIAGVMDIPFLDEPWSDALIDINRVFPQRFDQCVPSFGYNCEFRKICHGRVADPTMPEHFVGGLPFVE
jgi:hypothetical protein